MSNESNENQQSLPPLITVRSSPESKQIAKTFLLVFQRYLDEADEYRGTKQIPPLFVDGLLDHVLEQRVRLDLDDTFYLRFPLGMHCDSTSTKAILEFSVDQARLQRQWRDEESAPATDEMDVEESLVGFKVARKYDGDTQTMDIRTGRTKSNGGHYMSSLEDRVVYVNHKDIIPPGEPGPTEILREHWIAPHKWWNGNEENPKKAILIRPSTDSDALDRYCPAAQRALSEGYTLFMAANQNDLIQIVLPGRNGRVKVVIAGLMWREQNDQAQRSRNTREFIISRTSDLKFIIPERRCRHGIRNLDFQDGILVWDAWDEYKYTPGAWR